MFCPDCGRDAALPNSDECPVCGRQFELTCDICGGVIEDDGAHHDVIVHEACHESKYKMDQMP